MFHKFPTTYGSFTWSARHIVPAYHAYLQSRVSIRRPGTYRLSSEELLGYFNLQSLLKECLNLLPSDFKAKMFLFSGWVENISRLLLGSSWLSDHFAFFLFNIILLHDLWQTNLPFVPLYLTDWLKAGCSPSVKQEAQDVHKWSIFAVISAGHESRRKDQARRLHQQCVNHCGKEKHA